MTTSRITYRAFFETEAFEKDGGALPEGVSKDSSQPRIIVLSKDVDPEVYSRIPRVGETVWITLRGNVHQDVNWRVKDVTHYVDSPGEGVSILLEGQDSFGAVGITRITYLAYEKDRKQLKKTVESATIPRVGETVWIDLSGDSVRDVNWKVQNVTHNAGKHGTQSVLITLDEGNDGVVAVANRQKKQIWRELLPTFSPLIILSVGAGLIGSHIGMAGWETTLAVILLWFGIRSDNIFRRGHANG
jgi:hypothetical protein